MVKKIYILFLVVCSSYVFSQPCKDQVISDSLYKPADNTKVAVSALNCALKNGGGIQFLNQNGKYFLKIKPNQKIGFDDKGPLELKSGKKSFFVKKTKKLKKNRSKIHLSTVAQFSFSFDQSS